MYSNTGRQSGAARVLCSDTGSVYTIRNMENTFRRQDSVAEVCASNMQQHAATPATHFRPELPPDFAVPAPAAPQLT
jgi:hypothetical protein